MHLQTLFHLRAHYESVQEFPEIDSSRGVRHESQAEAVGRMAGRSKDPYTQAVPSPCDQRVPWVPPGSLPVRPGSLQGSFPAA